MRVKLSLRHDDDYYETPPWVLNIIKIETQLDIKVDGCANYENKKFPIYIPDDHYGGALNDEIPENQFGFYGEPVFINPPRSKNGKFVNKAFEQWKKHNIDIIMLLCWNDLGNKYGEKILTEILTGKISPHNLGKIKFYKNGIESQYPSRLTYFWAWFKKQ